MTGKKMVDFKQIERIFEKTRAAFKQLPETPQVTTSTDGPSESGATNPKL